MNFIHYTSFTYSLYMVNISDYSGPFAAMPLSADTNNYSGRAQLLDKTSQEAVELISWLLIELVKLSCFNSTEKIQIISALF